MGDASFFSASKPLVTPRQRHGASGDVFRIQPSPGPRMRLSYPTTPAGPGASLSIQTDV